MFKKSTTNKQLGLFTTASSLMCKRESKQYEDEKEWHMQFYRNVTCNIDEDGMSHESHPTTCCNEPTEGGCRMFG